jgi:hypothetical protein
MSLHPDIRKFWEGQGYFNLRESQWGDDRIIGWATIEKANGKRHNIIYLLEGGIATHYITGGTYYEPEALRIIKLAAFL